MGIARKDPSGAPVVEAVSELGVAARQIHWVDAGARHAVVAAGALPALLRFRDVYRALNRVIVHASARLDPAAHIGAGHHHAVVIVDLDPVVILDAYPRGVPVVDPHRIHAARQQQHAVVVLVGGVDVPFAVRRDVVQHQRALVDPAFHDVAGLARLELGLVGRYVLAEVQVPGVVDVQRLAAGERAPGHQPLDVHAPGGVGAAVVHHAAPARAGEQAFWLARDVTEVHNNAACVFGEVGERQPD